MEMTGWIRFFVRFRPLSASERTCLGRALPAHQCTSGTLMSCPPLTFRRIRENAGTEVARPQLGLARLPASQAGWWGCSLKRELAPSHLLLGLAKIRLTDVSHTSGSTYYVSLLDDGIESGIALRRG